MMFDVAIQLAAENIQINNMYTALCVHVCNTTI